MKLRKAWYRVYRRPEGDETTQSTGGAPTTHEETGETVGSGNDERLARMNAIADQHETQVADELANVNDDGTTEPFRTENQDNTESESTATGEETPPTEPETPPQDPEVKKFKIKVNGRELELTEEELIARAQKVEAADEYLRQAKQTTAPEPRGPSPEELRRLQDEQDLALARAIQMGNEEEAVAALRKIREQAGKSLSFSMDDVSAAIDQRLEFRNAFENFRKEYSDIASDPVLFKLAREKDEELVKNGDRRPYAERYDEIGKELRSWVGKVRGASAPVNEVQNQNKLEKKASAPKVPSAANKKAEPPPQDDETEETPQQVIANMARQRGGPQWMRN